MKFSTAVVIFSTICAAYLAVSQSTETDILKAEFARKVTTIQTLTKLYNEYDEAKKSGLTLKQKKLLKEFLSKFESNFTDHDEWLISTITAKKGLMQDAIRRNEYHYRYTKEFFDAMKSLVVSAILVNYQYHKIRAHQEKVEEIEKFRLTSIEKFDRFTQDTLRFLKEEVWKKQFKLDVDKRLQTLIDNELSVEETLQTMLSNKYPFREWLVINVDETSRYFECHSSEEHYERLYMNFGSLKRLLVFQMRSDKYRDDGLPQSIINNISQSANDSHCATRFSEIQNESLYVCGKLPLFAIFQLNGRDKSIASVGKSTLLQSKIVERSLLNTFCIEKYEILLFG